MEYLAHPAETATFSCRSLAYSLKYSAMIPNARRAALLTGVDSESNDADSNSIAELTTYIGAAMTQSKRI